MKEFLSIKEVADYLGVDYKTIYRLVQQAEIRAAKVGGVYRIPQQEVEAYFERQRQVLVRQASEAAPIRCGRCLRLLAPYEIEGPCEADGCEEPLCRACWQDDPDHRCRQHVRSREERLMLARAQLEQGAVPLLLTSEQAYRREVLYLSRVEAKLHELASIPHPLNRRPIRVASWDQIGTREQQLDRFREAAMGSLDEVGGGLLPTNPRLAYRPGQGLILEVAVYSDLATHLRLGFVTQASTHTQIFEQLGRAIERAEGEDSLIVMGLAATAGWDREAAGLIEGEGAAQRPFYHRRVAPLLVDLANDRLLLNRTDERLDLLASLFSPEMAMDVVRAVMSRVEALLRSRRSGVYQSEIVEQERAGAAEVAEAFDRLAATGRYRVRRVDNGDRVLER